MSAIKSICILIGMLSTQFLNAQCMQYEVPAEQIISESTLIIEGEVLSSEAFVHSTRNSIYSLHDIKIFKVLKGHISTSQIQVLTRGGRVNDTEQVVNPEVNLSAGSIGVFMLKGIADVPDVSYITSDLPENNVYNLWTMGQAFYQYDWLQEKAISVFQSFDLRSNAVLTYIEDLTGQEPQSLHPYSPSKWLGTKTNADERMITTLSPSTITAGTNSVLTITGSGFGSSTGTVSFVFANNPSFIFNAFSSYITNWTDTSISIIVQGAAATGTVRVTTSTGTIYTSSSNLIVDYAITSYDDPSLQEDENIRYVSPNSTGAVTYRLNNSFASNTPAVASLTRAIDSWRCDGGLRLEIGANTSTNVASNDGENVIMWSSSLPNGTLGVATRSFLWCSAPPTDRYAVDTDVEFNSTSNWQFGPANPSGSQNDFESVALHELGHNVGLGHINNVGEVMHPSIQSGTTNRNLDGPALGAALYMLPLHQAGGIACSGYFPITPLPSVTVSNTASSGAGSLPQALADACGGGAVTFDPTLAGSTINLGGAPILIDKNTTLVGLGANQLTLSGNNQNRIFNIATDFEFNLSEIRLINGKESTNGGAFYNQGQTTLNNVILEGNTEGSTSKAFSTQAGKTVTVEGEVEVRE